MRLLVGSLEGQNEELIEAGCRALNKARDGILSFLDGMFILPSVCRKRSVTLVRCVLLREIHAHNPDANRMTAFSHELLGLPNQIADYSVDLLDHRLGKYLRLGPNLDVRDWTARNGESLIHDRLRNGDQFAECSIASPA